jgi:hypothetical protein
MKTFVCVNKYIYMYIYVCVCVCVCVFVCIYICIYMTAVLTDFIMVVFVNDVTNVYVLLWFACYHCCHG